MPVVRALLRAIPAILLLVLSAPTSAELADRNKPFNLLYYLLDQML
nr:hypothetical protein [Pseudomonas mendocina]